MARARSDKSKSKPSDKSVDKKKKMKTGQSEEANAAKAESIELARSEDSARHDSLESAAKPRERQEQQRTQEPSADLEELDVLPEDTLSTASPSPDNGHHGIEDDLATHRRVAERAFMLFQENGCKHGNDWAHWFEAERQIRV
jgi:hypothetical protein